MFGCILPEETLILLISIEILGSSTARIIFGCDRLAICLLDIGNYSIPGEYMLVSTKGRYALRMMLQLAESNKGPVRIKDVSEAQGISAKYLEQIIPILNRSDILKTTRGFQGGYRLSKSPDRYTVGQILRLTEGNLSPVACLDHDPVECERSPYCATLPVWQGLYRVINQYLDGITLQDILDQEREKYTHDYMI